LELNIHEEKFMIADIIETLTKDSKPYYRFTLYDSNCKQYNAIMFNIKDLANKPSKGDVVLINGVIQQYNGQLQLKISDFKKVEDAKSEDFLPKSSYDTEDMFVNLKNIVFGNLKNEYLIKLCTCFFEDEDVVIKFKKTPAAKTIHHAYIGGLLEHTLSITKLALVMANHYKKYVNQDLLIVGALFHDIGKIYELDLSEGINYSSCGRLVGHLLMGIERINDYIRGIEGFPRTLKDLVIHMIASHHGFLEYGSPQKPKTYEATLLYYIDDLDAKINTMNSIFEKEGIEEGWSSYDKLLDRQIFKHNIED
jgi:3'-5' exoribonuclease